ncbi:polysaccharide lyase family 8 super-sandwich domain-containing protein [Pleomorphovibrio marinus]|uniref:polysaccharide lyase family 8 super-sandwich domain-containing protein n=1 Tax=Pleomorphovibrio marinus TaxID=2164132 RepID=UPI0018E5768D|nr:polysaccharide lyase family 8 super-sandwich domain-containing protein [Pleomorphovibrio marinus]
MVKQTDASNSYRGNYRVIIGTFWFLTLSFLFQCSPKPLKGDYSHHEALALERYATLVDQKVSNAQARRIMDRYAGGSWKDIDYTHNARTGWKTIMHLNRCVQLARIHYGKASQERGMSKEEARKMLEGALYYWKEKDFRNPNWFQNDIGVPGKLRDVLVLMEGELAPDLREWILGRLAEDTYGNKSGTNLIWLADIKMHLGLFRSDPALIAKSMELIAGEIHVGEGLGIQEDYSFLFHDRRLQMYSYGRGFLEVTAQIAWQMRDTPWALEEEKVQVLRNFALEGYQWMARGSFSVPSTMDRSSSRRGGLTRPRSIATFEMLAELDMEFKNEYGKLIAAQRSVEAFSLVGIKSFPKADFLVKHGKEGSFFVKWLSDRTLPTESINNENLRGRLLNAGNVFILRDGTEYTNLMPFWDWDLLPGFTTIEGVEAIRREPFTGALVHRETALIYIDVKLLGTEDQQVLNAKKAWFIQGNTLVGLVSDIQKKGEGMVTTALDQSRWQGKTTWVNQKKELGMGKHKMEGEAWVLHHGVAYYSVGKGQYMEVRQEEVSAYWESVNLRYRGEDPVFDKVFHPLVITDGTEIEYAIQLIPNGAKQPKKHWKTLQNDTDAQVIEWENGVIVGVLHAMEKPLEIMGWKLEANMPVLFLIEDEVLLASRPDTGIKGLNLRVNGKKLNKTVNNQLVLDL